MKCDKCKDGEMVTRKGKYGDFLACDNYPECVNTKKLEESSVKTPIKASNEYHLTPEQCRSNALECAFSFLKMNMQSKFTAKEVIMCAKAFEDYIFGVNQDEKK